MKRLFLLGLMLLAISQAALATDAKQHQDEPTFPFTKEIR